MSWSLMPNGTPNKTEVRRSKMNTVHQIFRRLVCSAVLVGSGFMFVWKPRTRRIRCAWLICILIRILISFIKFLFREWEVLPCYGLTFANLCFVGTKQLNRESRQQDTAPSTGSSSLGASYTLSQTGRPRMAYFLCFLTH